MRKTWKYIIAGISITVVADVIGFRAHEWQYFAFIFFSFVALIASKP